MVYEKPKKMRLLSLAVAVGVVCASLLGGCGSEKEETQSTASSSKQVSSTSTASKDGETKDFVTLSWYMRMPINNEKDQEAVEAEANKIIKEKINANVHFNLIDVASWAEKMKMMSAAGEPYDLVFTTGGTNSLSSNVQRGAFLPVDDLLKKYGQTIVEKVDPRAWKAVTYSGKLMAIPAQTPYSSPISFVFKKDLVEKYSFDYKSVKTLQDLEPYLETIKKNEPGITSLLAGPNQTAAGVTALDYTGYGDILCYDEKNEKALTTFDISEYIKNIRTLNDYYKKGYIAKDASVKTDYVAEAKSGKYAVMRDNGGYTEDGSKSTAVYGFPCVESLYGYPIISTNYMISAATAISKTSKNPERAMMLLNLVWSDKYLSNTLAFGVEGKNYTVISGKGTDNPTIEAKSGAEQTWAIWHNWLGPLWDQWDSNWNTKEALELMQQNNKSAKTSKILGFTFDIEPVKTEMTQISAIHKEVNPVLNTGIMPDFDKYIAETQQRLKNAGLDKVLAEMEKQISDWKAQNK